MRDEVDQEGRVGICNAVSVSVQHPLVTRSYGMDEIADRPKQMSGVGLLALF